tara:strand:- start:835 stop:1182 length:348 start_codon:yes stop_codon:yes gene_type:complete
MIKGPKNAIPTTKGWRHETSGELLKAAKLSQAMIDEWYGATAEPAAPAPEPVEEVAEVEDLLVHTHGDEEHSHEDGDMDHHHHDDGTVHDHDDGEEEHTHVAAPKKKRRWGISTK